MTGFTVQVHGESHAEIAKKFHALASAFDVKPAKTAKAAPAEEFNLDNASVDETEVEETETVEEEAEEVHTAQMVLDALNGLAKKNAKGKESAKAQAAAIAKKYKVKAISKLSDEQATEVFPTLKLK